MRLSATAKAALLNVNLSLFEVPLGSFTELETRKPRKVALVGAGTASCEKKFSRRIKRLETLYEQLSFDFSFLEVSPAGSLPDELSSSSVEEGTTHATFAAVVPVSHASAQAADGSVEASSEIAQAEEPKAAGKPGRKRIHAEPPALNPDGPPVSVYQRLQDYGLLKKLTDIVMAKAAVPWHLREDATQEVHMTWLGLTVKPEFVRNQLANYAFLSGQHAALKLRRAIGAVVTLPSALFRTGRDSAFMESIGAAVNPFDVADCENMEEMAFDTVAIEESHVGEGLFNDRLGKLGLNSTQLQVARHVLVDKWDIQRVSDVLELSLSDIEKLLLQVANKLQAHDESSEKSKDSYCSEKPARKAPRLSLASRTGKVRSLKTGQVTPIRSKRVGRPRKTSATSLPSTAVAIANLANPAILETMPHAHLLDPNEA